MHRCAGRLACGLPKLPGVKEIERKVNLRKVGKILIRSKQGSPGHVRRSGYPKVVFPHVASGQARGQRLGGKPALAVGINLGIGIDHPLHRRDI